MFSELLHFCQQHWMLSGGLLASLILFAWYERRYQIQRLTTTLSPAHLVQRINRDEVVIVDIRSKTDFDNGHIISAVHIPAENIESKPEQLKKFGNKTIVLVCNRGITTARVQSILAKTDLPPAQCLEGGMTAWKEAELPIKVG